MRLRIDFFTALLLMCHYLNYSSFNWNIKSLKCFVNLLYSTYLHLCVMEWFLYKFCDDKIFNFKQSF